MTGPIHYTSSLLFCRVIPRTKVWYLDEAKLWLIVQGGWLTCTRSHGSHAASDLLCCPAQASTFLNPASAVVLHPWLAIIDPHLSAAMGRDMLRRWHPTPLAWSRDVLQRSQSPSMVATIPSRHYKCTWLDLLLFHWKST